MSEKIQYGDFSKVDIRVGTILEASELPNARKPAWVMKIDFGEFGVLKSSAQITALYSKDALIGKQVMAVVNLEPRQVGSIMSECLVLGFPVPGSPDEVILAQPERHVPNGSQLS